MIKIPFQVNLISKEIEEPDSVYADVMKYVLHENQTELNHMVQKRVNELYQETLKKMSETTLDDWGDYDTPEQL